MPDGRRVPRTRRPRPPRSSRAYIRIRATSSTVTVEISDDGVGVDASATGGYGMSGMRERAELLGGQLDVTSQPGDGTAVRLLLHVKRKP